MLRDRFWETHTLAQLTKPEWEALCDGCGKCCLNKLEDPDTSEVAFTRVACRLLDGDTCQCANYERRKEFVPECVVLTPSTLGDIAYWMPRTCAYRLLHENRPLPDWHPLISGSLRSVHDAGQSVLGWTVSEATIYDEDEWESYIIEDL